MCVYHYEDSKRAEMWIWMLLMGTILFSVGVSVPMFILTYPGDECLLFVSVRGEALIYGNPAGCNFISYGHCFLVLTAIVVLCLMFCRPKKGILRRKDPKEVGSTRSLRGSVPNGGIGLGQSHYNIQSEDTVSQFGVSRFFSTKAIALAGVSAIFALITALVIISGYLVTCDELHYETRRQVLGRTTLGSPIRNLNIQCWSLFRDVDFHTRFHFDHYEFSGQWHGQYRGYKHGRVHEVTSDHEHLIDVALALELSLAGSWISAVLWVSIVTLMILLKRRQKTLQRRELAESIEDAKIFASSRQLDPTQNIMMQPLDQMSMTSNQSSVLSQKPSVFSATSVSTNPMVNSYGQQSPVVQQQMLSQQEILNQQMLQMQQLQMANQQRLHQSQPVLNPQQQPVNGQRPMSQQMGYVTQQVVPTAQQMGPTAQQMGPTAQQMGPTAQQMGRPVSQQMGPATQQIQAPIVQQVIQQQHAQQTAQLHQQYVTQQNGVQYVQMSNGMLIPMVTQQQGQQTQQLQPQIAQQSAAQQNYIVPNQQPPTQQPTNNTDASSKPVSSFNKHTYSSLSELKGQGQPKTDVSDSKNAQRAQLAISQDAGLKCSQI